MTSSRAISFIGTLVISCAAAALDADFSSIILEVNSNPSATWTAALPRLGSVEDVRALCGTFMPGHPQFKPSKLPSYGDLHAYDVSAFAAELDLRTKFPNCSVIAKIRDQSECGSCWAFGSVECFQGRRCIAGHGDIQFSPLDVASNSQPGDGCTGGNPTGALEWMSETGVVTGGDFSDDNIGSSCQPYGFPPCAHHVNKTKYPACPKTHYKTKVVESCTDTKYAKSYAADKTRGMNPVQVFTADQALAALNAGGTVSAAFEVYADFPTYKSGVYKHVAGEMLGGHAIALIGYGRDPTAGDYWLVKNSWNEQWGDGGTFKIVRGKNECGIESAMATIDFNKVASAHTPRIEV